MPEAVRGMRVSIIKAASGAAIALLACAPTLALAVTAPTTEAQRAALQQQLDQIEAQIAQQQKLLTQKEAEGESLQNDIDILDAQIKKNQLDIQARNLTIQQIEGQIGQKEDSIGVLDDKVAAGQASLAQLIRLTNESDDTSLIELALSGTFSDFFQDLDSYEALQSALGTSFDQMAALKDDLTQSKAALESQQEEQEQLRQVSLLQQQTIKSQENKKQQLLDETKGQEAAYQNIIANQQQTASQIRSALFAIRDSAAIQFGDAYQYAKQAEAKTGVPAALTLAILTQETNLGENVGQCLLTNTPNKGDGIGKNTGTHFSQVMKGSRDVDPFMDITASLGLDPYSMVVSCPPGYGYGGAMGPAQFIPSTWVLYEDRISAMTGVSPANPWDARTAIFAAAILMMDNGAGAGTYSAERLAALRYFAGWGNANKPAYAFYGDDVMDIMARLQKQIDILNGA
ncbi:MAG TPA: hypothetical protein VFL98_01445 [Candidatus Paceibacterota bacterium]|nr:hypothetical protein [Candidatus Paceibacterota bacterium]